MVSTFHSKGLCPSSWGSNLRLTALNAQRSLGAGRGLASGISPTNRFGDDLNFQLSLMMQYSICKCELHILRFQAYGEVLEGYGVPREIISTIWVCSCKSWASYGLPNSPKICNFIYYFHPKLIALRWTTLHPQQCGEWDSYVKKHGMVQYYKQLKKT